MVSPARATSLFFLAFLALVCVVQASVGVSPSCHEIHNPRIVKTLLPFTESHDSTTFHQGNVSVTFQKQHDVTGNSMVGKIHNLRTSGTRFFAIRFRGTEEKKKEFYEWRFFRVPYNSMCIILKTNKYKQIEDVYQFVQRRS